jgi:uncharacterized protein involved in outer membrane biogenesis
MKRPGKRTLRLACALVLGPPVLWGLIVAFLPTGWARDKVVACLRESTGQEVRLASVHLRPFGGVGLSGLEIAAPKTAADPWLSVRSLEIDVSIRDLIAGRISPTVCLASGVSVRVRRDAEGRLEFEDLLKPSPRPTGKADSPDAPDTAPAMAFRLEDSRVTVVDDATSTLLEFTEVQGHGTSEGPLADLTELTARLNGGTVEMAARLDRAMGTAIEGHIQVEQVVLGGGMKALAYALPLVAPVAEDSHAQGVLTLDLTLKARGETSQALAQNLTGRGNVLLDDLTLDNSRVMAEVSKVLPVPGRGQLGSLRGDFKIAGRRVTTGNTVLKIADIPVDLMGWSDFDGRLDYSVKSDKIGKKVAGLADRLPSEARELLADLPVDDFGSLVNVRITGTIDRMTARPADGSALARRNASKDPARRAEDRAKLKAAGKKFLDRVVR